MKQLYCPHRVTVSGILQYCTNGKVPIDCEHCDCPDKKELDVTVTTSSSKILSNKMTREEEIDKRASDFAFEPHDFDEDWYDMRMECFVNGAKWADKTMIERACQFFWSLSLEKMDEYFSSSENLWQFTDDFKKAMEE